MLGGHRDLTAISGLAGDGPDLHYAFVYLGYLKLEQASKEVLVRAREDELGASKGAVHLQQVELLPLAGPVVLRPHLLRHRQDRLRLTKVDYDVIGFDPLDEAGHDVPFAVRELLEHHLPLRLPQALEDDLLGRLSGDAAGVGWIHFCGDDIVNGGVRFDLLGVLDRDIGLVIFYLGHHRLLLEDAMFAGLPVYAYDYVALEVAVFLVGGDEGSLHGLQDNLPGQVFLRSELRDRYHKLALHGLIDLPHLLFAGPKKSGSPPTLTKSAIPIAL